MIKLVNSHSIIGGISQNELDMLGQNLLWEEGKSFGVAMIREVNVTLLGKWCWTLYIDKRGLWYKVWATKYGVERGHIKVGGLKVLC